MEKKILPLIIISLFSLTCTSPQLKPERVLFDFSINTFDTSNNHMLVTYKITNATKKDFVGGQWELHWNQIVGTPLSESLPDGVSFEYVNGQQYLILNFDEKWPLKSGDSISFEGVQEGIISREVMGPMGAFIVYNKNQVLDLETRLHWEEAKGIANLNIPSATERYQEYSSLEPLPKEALSWVVPQPQIIKQNAGTRQVDHEWHIFLENPLKQHKNIFEKHFRQQFEQSIFWVDAPEKANVKIKHQSSIPSEGYQLNINKASIDIEASRVTGVFYALQSLDQIIHTASREQSAWPLLEIEDAPRFAYRGFMLDIARNFYDLEKIKQVIDAMGYYKLNYLDLRLSDDEGWRIEIPGLPELTKVGGKRGFTSDESDKLIPFYGSGAGGGARGNGFLSKDDFMILLTYAHEKNITVLPQISFPSHARAAIRAMATRNDNTYRLVDPQDQSQYRSAQLFNDNVVCICQESAFDFYEKVVLEMKAMYEASGLSLTQFSIGADELPYGIWKDSALCKAFMKKNHLKNTLELYNYGLKKLKKIFDQHNIVMSGWEDFLLEHSEKSQEETQIKKEQFNQEVIPYVWNNIWGEGREDMIYKFANKGFKTVMSNSAAFYFDMTDDRDFENYGLNWSGFVSYIDAWATDPENVFASVYLTRKNNISAEEIAKKTKLNPSKASNLWGIQSQLWTETVRDESIFDALFMPNLIVFAERAWAPRPQWISLKEEAQINAMKKAWNTFSNTLGQRQLPLIDQRLRPWTYDLPKAGGLIKDNKLYLKQAFPGMEIRYTLDGTVPTAKATLYQKPLTIDNDATIKVRVFNALGRGGKTIEIK